MKNIKSKKLNRSVNTICDFNALRPNRSYNGETTTGGDTTDTTTTLTILTTTISTSPGEKG